MILEQHPELSRLSTSEKLIPLNKFRDNPATIPDQIPVSGPVIAGLDCRMKEYQKDPSAVSTWEEIQFRIPGPLQPAG